jgi:branched-chain amino acid transport system permease protein
MERLTIHPARRSSIVTLIIITIGVDFAIRGLALLAWGTTPYSLPAFSQGGALIVLGAVVSRQRLWIMGLTVLILVGLYFFFEHTLLGKAVRACAANRTAARLMGISPSRMSLFSFTLSAGLGAVGGIVIAPLTLVSYDMGLNLAIKGFVAAIMGGLVNTPGAVVGGVLLGVLESLTAGILTSGLKDAIAYVILFLILFLRPGGIFGGQGGRGAGL